MNRLADILEGNYQNFHSGVTDIFKEANDYSITEIKDTSVIFNKIKEYFRQQLEKKISHEKAMKLSVSEIGTYFSFRGYSSV